jgi:hypothetical protein
MSRYRLRALVAACALSVPVVAQQFTLTPVADNTLYQDASGSLSNGAGSSLFCGRTNVFGGAAARRALLKFDLASVAPPGTTVIHAELSIGCAQGQGGSATIEMYRVTSAWGEGSSDAGFPGGSGAAATTGDATWLHTFYPSSTWTTPGGDYAPTFSAKTDVDGAGAYVFGPTWELRADCQDMLANPANNHGWILISPEIAGQAKRFESRESPGLEPTLTVIFAPAFPASKTSIGAGCVGSAAAPFTLDAFGYGPTPALGDDQFAFYVSNGPAGGSGFLFFSTTTTAAQPIGGCNLYLDLGGLTAYAAGGFGPFPMLFDGTGLGAVGLPLPPAFPLVGFSAGAQAFALDAGGPGGIVLSNALFLVLGT